MSETPRLTVDLVPSTCWWSNLRSELTEEQWDTVRRWAYRQAGYRCTVCGGRGPAHPVEADEVWIYDESAPVPVQRLAGVRALCPACHEAKHLGWARMQGSAARARAHLARVNGWTPAQVEGHIAETSRQWLRRSGIQWELDVFWLTDTLGIKVDVQRGQAAHAGGEPGEGVPDDDDHEVEEAAELDSDEDEAPGVTIRPLTWQRLAHLFDESEPED